MNSIGSRFQHWIGSMSINRKLLVINLLVSALAMTAMGAGLAVFVYRSAYRQMVFDLETHAAVLADNCTAALTFDDSEDARDVLNSLRANPPVRGARLFDEAGEVFASYLKQGETAPGFPERPKPAGHYWEGNFLYLTRAVDLEGRIIGHLVIVADNTRLNAGLQRTLWVFLLTLFAALIPAWPASRRLQRLIALPVIKLAAAANHITQGADYSLRVDWDSRDELGQCIAAFNAMLAQIEVRSEESEHLRRLLQNIIDSMPSMIICTDKQGRVTWWNAQASIMSQGNSSRGLNKPLSYIFPQLGSKLDLIRTAIAEGKPQKNAKVHMLMGGRKRIEDITVYPLTADGVDGAVIRVDDVTDRVRMEEAVIQSEKMLSVGGLAAGMAHEINNPLAGILQNIQVIRNRMSPDLERNRTTAVDCGTTIEAVSAFMKRRDILSMADSIYDSGRRAAQIVDNMLSFSRKSEADVQLNDPGNLLDRTIQLASNDYDLKRKYDFRQIEIVRIYDPHLGPVPCEGSKLQQVFLNLLKNGAEAMAEENRQRRAHGAPAKASRFVLRTCRDKPFARIEIEDNGPGMDEATRKRVLEPFFTTKEVGVGTGLGLSVSYFIITENHRGAMEVESSPGKGTRFIINLPLVREKA